MKTLTVLCLIVALAFVGCTEAPPTEVHVERDAPPTSLEADASASKHGASGKVKAPAPHLEVEILPSNSDFINHLYLVSPGPDLFIATDDDTGIVVPLPPVRRNQELVFEIRVHDPDGNDTGVRWQTGPPSRNPDRAGHARVTYQADGSIRVEFEDIDASGWGMADEPNFLDAIFVVSPR